MFKPLVWLDPEKIPAQAGIEPWIFRSRGGRLTTRPTRRSAPEASMMWGGLVLSSACTSLTLAGSAWRGCVWALHVSMELMTTQFSTPSRPVLSYQGEMRTGRKVSTIMYQFWSRCSLVTCFTSQQHASVSQGRICFTSQQHASVSQVRICFTSQQHASVSQGRICFTSQQHASVSQVRICFTSQQHASVSQGRICFTPQQHASVSHGRICSDKSTCCHTEIKDADPTCCVAQLLYTDTGPSSPSTDPLAPGAWQGVSWSTGFFFFFYVPGHARFSVRWVRRSPQSAAVSQPVLKASCGPPPDWAMSGVSSHRRWGRIAGCGWGFEDPCRMDIGLSGKCSVCGGGRGVDSVQWPS